MKDSQLYLCLDYESRSECDLKKVGAAEYARHPSTEILCVAWRTGTRETLAKETTHILDIKLRPHDIKRKLLVDLLNNPHIGIVAHNAGFEQVITEFVLGKHVTGLKPVARSRWICTAALAATHALPRNLEGACSVLGLEHQKDPEGRKLIRRHCVPQKITKTQTRKWNDDPRSLERLSLYCARDVTAMAGLFLRLPPLTPTERAVWELNQLINLRGLFVDRPLVATILKMIEVETESLISEAWSITGGIYPTQNAQIRKWCALNGAVLPNTQKKTIDDAIESGLVSGLVARVLQIRQSVSKTSTGKYAAFEQRSASGSRLRDLVMYHGASTGRDTGTGVQPHNLPRGTLGDLYDLAVDVVMTGDLEWVRALLGDPMSAFSSLLRAVIRATPGLTLYCGDFNAIEARVVFWLAGHQRGLDLFTGGRDPYREMAARIYSKQVKYVTDEERALGKSVILGCGFGMGAAKFEMTCKNNHIPITTELAELAVQTYRTTNAPVPQLWKNLERAAIAATRNPGKRYAINRTTWFVRDDFLYCELPSGRRLAYYEPIIKIEATTWGHEREVLYHGSVNPKTKQWESTGTYGGKLCENVTQAVARDIMVEAQLRTHAAGYIALISVHDELLNERTAGTIEEFEALMTQLPSWAKDLPIKVKAWSGVRYRK
jgi:DNA polymerase